VATVAVIQDQLSSCTGLYVEDQLAQQFKDLVEFVKKAEQQQKRMAVAEGSPIPGKQSVQQASSEWDIL
jgi:hypothetical protein